MSKTTLETLRESSEVLVAECYALAEDARQNALIAALNERWGDMETELDVCRELQEIAHEERRDMRLTESALKSMRRIRGAR